MERKVERRIRICHIKLPSNARTPTSWWMTQPCAKRVLNRQRHRPRAPLSRAQTPTTSPSKHAWKRSNGSMDWQKLLSQMMLRYQFTSGTRKSAEVKHRMRWQKPCQSLELSLCVSTGENYGRTQFDSCVHYTVDGIQGRMSRGGGDKRGGKHNQGYIARQCRKLFAVQQATTGLNTQQVQGCTTSASPFDISCRPGMERPSFSRIGVLL